MNSKIILISAIGGIIIVLTILLSGIITITPFITFDEVFSSQQLRDWNLQDESLMVITPLLTANAYRNGAFYNYFRGECNEECLTISINQNENYVYTSSLSGVELFKRLNATMIDDWEFSKNTWVIKEYDVIVILHNEYVTREMFDALQEHPNVIYLYPNALYGEIEITDKNMTLIQGHQYKNKTNGFDWEFENTHPFEYDIQCDDWEYYPIKNGKMLNCYPELALMIKPEILMPIIANAKGYIIINP